MVALNTFQPPPAAGPAQSRISVSGSTWNTPTAASASQSGLFTSITARSARSSVRSAHLSCFSLLCVVSVRIKAFHLNRSVLCWSRWVRASVVSRSRDPHTASITFQCIPGHDPSRRFHCTSGLPSAGLQHSTSVWSVTLMNLTFSFHCRYEWDVASANTSVNSPLAAALTQYTILLWIWLSRQLFRRCGWGGTPTLSQMSAWLRHTLFHHMFLKNSTGDW